LDKIKFVVASRESEVFFYEKTATGRSLRFYDYDFLDVRLFANNNLGLPKVYNTVIRETVNDPCTLIFAHDDLHLLDFYWLQQVSAGLSQFGVIGVAGNKRRAPRQASWNFLDADFNWDSMENLSGIVAHGKGFPPLNVSVFGPAQQQVKLLDGLFLAVHSSTLHQHELRFDERFDFHFYDMDFCRQAEVAGVSCGTWPMSIIHESPGGFGSQAWADAYARYLDKWSD
jgi:GT2 family glycosyltransferase